MVKFLRKNWVLIITLLVACVLFFCFYDRIKQFSEAHKNSIRFKAFIIANVCLFTFWIQKLLVIFFNWYSINVLVKTRTQLDDKFFPFLRKLVQILIYVLCGVIILNKLGVNINALIAALGVSSLAIALAAQDTIANIIAGFLIMIDRPFRIGDMIKLPSGEKVTVLEIGVRRSRFLNSDDKSIIIMPNLDMSKSKIVNYTYAE